MVDPGKVTAPTTPFDAKTAFYAASKVKNLLTGMPISDDDLTRVTTKGAAGLQELVSTWMTSDGTQAVVQAKMVGFFRNMFQQTGFIPTEDFKLQLLTNGGFDFGGTNRTRRRRVPIARPEPAGQLRADRLAAGEGRPAVHGGAEHEPLPDDDRPQEPLRPDRAAERHEPAQHLDHRAELDDRLFGHRDSDRAVGAEHGLERRAPAVTAAGNRGHCRGGAVVPTGAFKGTSKLFQRLLGFTPELRDAEQHHGVRRPPVEALVHGAGPVRLGLGDDRAQGEPRRPHRR